MFASSLALMLVLSLFETISLCRRMTADIKWRLAADAIAFDEAWDIYNRQTAWFDTAVTVAQAEWAPIAAERTSVWCGERTAYLFRSITPNGMPASNWVIRTDVQWPLPSGNFARLSRNCEVIRGRSDRNLFRAAQ